MGYYHVHKASNVLAHLKTSSQERPYWLLHTSFCARFFSACRQKSANSVTQIKAVRTTRVKTETWVCPASQQRVVFSWLSASHLQRATDRLPTQQHPPSTYLNNLGGRARVCKVPHLPNYIVSQRSRKEAIDCPQKAVEDEWIHTTVKGEESEGSTTYR